MKKMRLMTTCRAGPRLAGLRSTPRIYHRRSRRIVTRALSQPLVVLECDGVLVDLHTDGHRKAFNSAFQELGLECANWSSEVYHDLRRIADGTETGLVKFFFDKIGWPQTVATADYPALTQNIIKIKKTKLTESLAQRQIDLRKGVLEFVDALLADDVIVGVLTETQSDETDAVWQSMKELIGERRHAALSAIPWPKTSTRDEDAQTALGDRIRDIKRDEAKAFAESINARRREKQARMEVDAKLLQKTTYDVDPTFFLTMATSLGSSVRQCALVSASDTILQSASASGVLCVAVPAGLSFRLDFKGVHARFDGFGAGGGLTWSRLNNLLNERCPP